MSLPLRSLLAVTRALILSARIAEACCGMTAQAFLDIYHRKAVGLKVQQADALSRMLNVCSVPFIVKDGRLL